MKHMCKIIIFLLCTLPQIGMANYLEKSALEDNASDMTVYDLFDSVIIDKTNKHLFPHDNVESADKETLEEIYVNQCLESYIKLPKEELKDLGFFDQS